MKKRKLPSLVTILILTLITVIIWITFDVYRLFVKADDGVVPENVSMPLSPTLDEATLSQIESRIFLDDSEVQDQVIEAAPEVVETTETEETPTAEDVNVTEETVVDEIVVEE